MLTDRLIRDAKPKTTVYRFRDANVVCRGFGVTVSPAGAKTFFLSYTSPQDGKRKQVSLGRFPRLSLREARLKAAEMRNQVDLGNDPAVEKKQNANEQLQRRSLGTLQDLMDLYASDLEEDGKRSSKEVRRITDKDIPEGFLTRPAHLITRDDILDILTPIAGRGAPVHADNVRAYLRAAFELGLDAEGITRWRGKAPRFDLQFNPVASVRKVLKRKPRGQRTLSPVEVEELWNTELLTLPMHLALKLILTTGQRVEEVLGATWKEFDTEQRLWTIPGARRKTRHSSDEPHVVPLEDLHLDILKQIARDINDTTYLFPARGGGTPRRYDSLTHATRLFVKESEMVSFSPRDLRRTFKTLGGSFGISLEARNRIQGHGMTDVGSVHYDRWDYLPEKRNAMKVWSANIAHLLTGENNGRQT